MAWCRAKLAGEGVHLVRTPYFHHLFKKSNTICKVGGSKPALDLAILAACNHSLVDYGTFSVWGAYLARGEVVVANYRR